MVVQSWVWWVSVAVLLSFLVVDVAVIGRRPHEPSLRESSTAIAFYVALALVFGLGLWLLVGAGAAVQFYAGWLTEYSLSVDNLFVFIVIMSRFAVPKPLQQTALLVGIILALVLRGAFIAVGAAALQRFTWVFYVFGALLVWAAVRLVRGEPGDSQEFEQTRFMRWVLAHVPATSSYHGVRLVTRVAGRRVATPMLLVILALGSTDLLFALDSIPAIFGLTKEPYLVFTANVFALMGLRQLYFLIGGLIDRLVYLSHGLAVVLGFIGVKLVLEALHDNDLPFINGGRAVGWAPQLPIWASLLVIVVTLAVTAAASLARDRMRRGAAE